MIPRFHYSFPLPELFGSIKALFRPKAANTTHYQPLFPTSQVYEISSARAGITYSLRALGLRPNAGIGVQPYTCSSVMVAIREVGYRPVFIDINRTLTLDCNDLTHKLTDLDALIITHTFGIPADIRRIKELTGNLPVIEDCAHAFSCYYNGIQLGNFFDMAVFSFGNGKFPALGSGGLVVVNNNQYAAAISEIIGNLNEHTWRSEWQFISRQLLNSLLYSRLGYDVMYRFFNPPSSNRRKKPDIRLADNKKMHRTVQWRLKKNSDIIPLRAAKQKQNALTIAYTNLSAFDFVYHPDPDSNCFALVCLSAFRDDLYKHLIRSGVGAGKHFQYAGIWASTFGYQTGDCPTFDQLIEQIITIPCSYSLSQPDLSVITNALSQYAAMKLTFSRNSKNAN